MAEQQQNDVYNYGAGAPAAVNPMAIARRGIRQPIARAAMPVSGDNSATVVNQAPFYQQALAAGLGGGGAQWTASSAATVLAGA